MSKEVANPKDEEAKLDEDIKSKKAQIEQLSTEVPANHAIPFRFKIKVADRITPPLNASERELFVDLNTLLIKAFS